jgi:hypothetical protein
MGIHALVRTLFTFVKMELVGCGYRVRKCLPPTMLLPSCPHRNCVERSYGGVQWLVKLFFGEIYAKVYRRVWKCDKVFVRK